jgi:hypothetical protein
MKKPSPCTANREDCQAIREAVSDPNWLAYYLRVYRKRRGAESRWDFNLVEGELKEEELKKVFTGETSVEVKRDFSVSRTGNVAIELKEGLKPTGLSVTEADWWAIVLDGEKFEGEVVVLIKTERLKRLVKACGISRRGGDRKQTLIKLLDLDDLFYSAKEKVA